MVYNQKCNLSTKWGSCYDFCNNPADNNQENSGCSFRKIQANTAWMWHNLECVKRERYLSITHKQLFTFECPFSN